MLPPSGNRVIFSIKQTKGNIKNDEIKEPSLKRSKKDNTKKQRASKHKDQISLNWQHVK
jgi:hypothetical protein